MEEVGLKRINIRASDPWVAWMGVYDGDPVSKVEKCRIWIEFEDRGELNNRRVLKEERRPWGQLVLRSGGEVASRN